MTNRLRGLVGFGLLLAGCQTQVKQPPEKAEAAYAPIFTQNREFTYLVSRFHEGRHFVVDTVSLTSTGIVWNIDSTQNGIRWKNADNRRGTGVKEGPNGVWIHPPRFDEYNILELSPFPEIKLPFQTGQEWDWELAVGDHYSNPAWAVWKGDIVVRTHYKAEGTQAVETPLGRLTCQRVTAESHSPVGESALQLLFHPRYGFVELDYRNIDGQRLRFELVSVGIENKFEAGAYFGEQ
ncbi:hypothetical protein [Hymenobacter psychrophilus]|uniref:DUF3108 domain-containing protein n=1 Tax=Hymenobacter psychrophilus TaxID=651662 RepID=A0A1H3CSS1_9BACT|nr:hypothetical protein [Hymenobacter psychrophilus]SDX57165.1 hypothetical protein SAMN04488069_102100 [Hymenobacter psychrophilus]